MSQNNPGLKKPMPVTKGFIYDIGTGNREADTTKIERGGDLRNRPSKNNGR